MFEVRVDRSKRRVELLFEGDYTHDRDAMHRAVHEAVSDAKGSGLWFDIVCDMTQMPVIHRDRHDSGEELMTWLVLNGMRNGAVAVGQVLQSMQLKRLSGKNEKYQYFNSMRDAQAWLDSRMKEVSAAA